MVVKNKLGKGQVYYIGAWSHDDALEYAILQQAFADAGAKVLNLPPYVFVEWRSGYYLGVNYSSDPATLPIPANAKVLHGQATLQPGEVAVWME